MDAFSIVMAVIAGAGTILSVIFAILAFGRNNRNDQAALLTEYKNDMLEIKTKLARVEADLSYLRQNVDKTEARFDKIEARLSELERNR